MNLPRRQTQCLELRLQSLFLDFGSGKMKSLYLRHNGVVLSQALGAELRELSFPVNQELDAVKRIVANPPEEVPEQLLKALEKDAKNLQKSLSSANDVLESRLQNLHGAAETEKVELVTVPAACSPQHPGAPSPESSTSSLNDASLILF